MSSLLAFIYASSAVLALPLNARSELHQLEISEQLFHTQAAASNAQQGLATFCGKVLPLERGEACEVIIDGNLTDAKSRLVLRMSARRFLADGDSFLPRDGRIPRLLDRERMRSPRGELPAGSDHPLATHTHICPVVENASFGDIRQDAERLCVAATASRISTDSTSGNTGLFGRGTFGFLFGYLFARWLS